MKGYKVIVDFAFASIVTQNTFGVFAKDEQFAKEKFHRYTHENYRDVNRSKEDEHIHFLGDELTQMLVSIEEVSKEETHQLTDLRMM